MSLWVNVILVQFKPHLNLPSLWPGTPLAHEISTDKYWCIDHIFKKMPIYPNSYWLRSCAYIWSRANGVAHTNWPLSCIFLGVSRRANGLFKITRCKRYWKQPSLHCYSHLEKNQYLDVDYLHRLCREMTHGVFWKPWCSSRDQLCMETMIWFENWWWDLDQFSNTAPQHLKCTLCRRSYSCVQSNSSVFIKVNTFQNPQ